MSKVQPLSQAASVRHRFLQPRAKSLHLKCCERECFANVKTRAQVLRAVAEDPDLNAAEINRAFVLMQYFGYLRRNPNDPQDTDYTSYDVWLTKLNQFNGNYVAAEMVKSFIVSGEYRARFGPP
jgi:hypothetical protein